VPIRREPAAPPTSPAALLSVSCSTALAAAAALHGEACRTPPVPIPGVSTPSTGSGPLGPTPATSPGLFHPGTLLSFRLQGFVPPGDLGPVSRSFLPCRFVPCSDGARGFEGLLPPGIGLSSRGANARPRPMPS
jgi:hypothetical protein